MAVLTREERMNKFMLAAGLDIGERNMPTLAPGPAFGIPALAAPTKSGALSGLDTGSLAHRHEWRYAQASRSDASQSLATPTSSSSSQVCCALGHPIQHTARASPWSCDGCQRVSTWACPRMERFRCSVCDYDLCELCHDAAAKARARVWEAAYEPELQTVARIAGTSTPQPLGFEENRLHDAQMKPAASTALSVPEDASSSALVNAPLSTLLFVQRAAHDAAVRSRLRRHQECDDTLQARGPQSCSSSPSAAREDAILAGERLLQARCRFLGLEQQAVEDDGNCQFRAVAQELFGSQALHGEVRAVVVDFLQRRSADFSAFSAADEWAGYLRNLAEPKAWGDELALRAAAEAYQIRVHVVSSTADNWYLVYEPEGGAPSGARDVFLTYIAPIHYNVLSLNADCSINQLEQTDAEPPAMASSFQPTTAAAQGSIDEDLPRPSEDANQEHLEGRPSSPRLASFLKGLTETDSRQLSQSRQLPGSPADFEMPPAHHAEKSQGSLWVPFSGHSAVSSLIAPVAAGQPLGASSTAFQQNRSSQAFSSPWVAQGLSGTRLDDAYDTEAGYSPYGEWRTHTGPSGRLGATIGTPRAGRRSVSSAAARPTASASSSVYSTQDARRHAARASSPVPRSNSPLPGRPRTPIRRSLPERRPISASAAVRQRSVEAGRGSAASPMRHSFTGNAGRGIGTVPISPLSRSREQFGSFAQAPKAAEVAAAEAASLAAEAAAQRMATASYLQGEMASRRYRGDASWWSRTPTHDVAGSYMRARSPLHYVAAPRLSYGFQNHSDWASSLRR